MAEPHSDYRQWAESPDRYRYMLRESPSPWCWACGRGPGHAPSWYHGPWLIHRHHIVRQPRVSDRRAVILLCPLCHGQLHGDRFPQRDAPPLAIRHQLWLKRARDAEFYSRVFLRAHHAGELPRAAIVPQYYRLRYCTRRGGTYRLDQTWRRGC